MDNVSIGVNVHVHTARFATSRYNSGADRAVCIEVKEDIGYPNVNIFFDDIHALTQYLETVKAAIELWYESDVKEVVESVERKT